MQHHHHIAISDTFHCKRSPSGDVVHVYNANNYLMAEYIVRTGRTSWQRVAPVTQREAVEKWLHNTYPIPAPVQPAKTAVKVKVKVKVKEVKVKAKGRKKVA
jgi:hypothetical protein